MQFPDEIQAQSTECPEKVRDVGWTRLLCIQTWCLWWFGDGTNVACVCSTYICVTCVYCVLFDLRRKLNKDGTNIRFVLEISNIRMFSRYSIRKFTAV